MSYSRKTLDGYIGIACAVISQPRDEDPAEARNGTRDFRKHFCFFSVKLYRLKYNASLWF